MVSAGKPWAGGSPGSSSSLAPGGRGASRAVSGPDVPIEAVLAGRGLRDGARAAEGRE